MRALTVCRYCGEPVGSRRLCDDFMPCVAGGDDMTFTTPFTVPTDIRAEQARREREERYATHEGLWIAVWTSGPRYMPRRCAHIVSRRIDRVPLCRRRIPYHTEIKYVPINEEWAPAITCAECRKRAAP